MEDKIMCPKCSSTQLSADKKGFSGVKAVGGAILTGGIGLLAGTHGSNDVIITCLVCGHGFKPGEDKVAQKKKFDQEMKTMGDPMFWVFSGAIILIVLWLFS